MKRVRLYITTLLLFYSLSAIGFQNHISANVRRPGSNKAKPNAETKADHDQRMKWWREARFGMFIHWGLYAVPAGEYRGLRTNHVGEWIMDWANIPRVEY